MPIDDVTAVASFITGEASGHSIGILIHCKNDPYVKSLIDHTKNVKPPFNHEVFGAIMLYNAYPTLESLDKFKTVIGVKFKTYYPYSIHPTHGTTIMELFRGNDLSYINDNDVICLH